MSTRDGNAEIYVMNVNGSGLLRLTTNSAIDAEPAWGAKREDCFHLDPQRQFGDLLDEREWDGSDAADQPLSLGYLTPLVGSSGGTLNEPAVWWPGEALAYKATTLLRENGKASDGLVARFFFPF